MSSSLYRDDLNGKFYNAVDNRVDIYGQDFKDVLNWILAHGGIPTPMFKFSAYVTGVCFELIWQKEGEPPFVQLDYQVANSPGLALACIQAYFGLPAGPVIETYTPPAPPPIPVPPPTPQPVNPVGDLIWGNMYRPAAGDTLGSGATYSDSRGKFVKQFVPNPFGVTIFWQKQ